MLSEQKNKNQLKPNKRRIKLLFTPFILFRSILWITFIFILVSCNTTEPPPPKPEKPKLIELKEITKSCTETFIKVTVKDTILPASVTITRDGKEIMNYYQTKTDTTLIDTGLAAAKTYLYKATIGNKEEEKSKELQVSTLPTTSNNFTWQKYTFGDGGINIFRDVAIIDENDIWVVGQIEITDTSANGYTNYNAVHWDGQKWELKRIYYYGDCSAVKYPPLTAIWAFSKNNIVVSNGGSIGWFDGKTLSLDCGVNPLLNGAIKKIWGSESADLFIVGNKGSIAHYNGISWEKIESGTDYNIKGLYGDVNPFTKEIEILCCASGDTKDSEVMRIKNMTAEKIDKSGLEMAVGLWFKAGIRYYIVGNGLFEKTYRNNNGWNNLNINKIITSNFMNGIRGNGLNDIIVSGAFGELLHFNGLRWKSLRNDKTILNNGSYFEVAVKGNLVVAVGYDETGAIILVGKRN